MGIARPSAAPSHLPPSHLPPSHLPPPPLHHVLLESCRPQLRPILKHCRKGCPKCPEGAHQNRCPEARLGGCQVPEMGGGQSCRQEKLILTDCVTWCSWTMYKNVKI